MNERKTLTTIFKNKRERERETASSSEREREVERESNVWSNKCTEVSGLVAENIVVMYVIPKGIHTQCCAHPRLL